MKQIQIIGNIGQDAVIQNTNGAEYARFSVAVNEKRKDGTEVVEWFTVFTKSAKLAQYLKAGTKVFVQGTPKTKVFFSEIQNAYLHSTTIYFPTIELLGSKQN